MRTSYHNHRGPSRQRRERKFQQVGRCSISFPKSMQLRLHYGQILFDSILTCASFLRHISFRFTFAINGLAIFALHNADLCKPLFPGRGALATRLRGGLVSSKFHDFFQNSANFRKILYFFWKFNGFSIKFVIFWKFCRNKPPPEPRR